MSLDAKAPDLDGNAPHDGWRESSAIAARVCAFALGVFAAANLLGEWGRPGFDANPWWLDLRFMPTWLSQPLIMLIAGLMIAWAVRPLCSRWRRKLTVGIALLACAIALGNAAHFFVLVARGTIHAGVPVPLSLFIAIGLLWLADEVSRSPSAVRPEEPLPQRRTRRHRNLIVALLTLAYIGVGFPLEQMFFFGKTDYRRRADAAVVFGARVYRGGVPSDALADRVRTACALYNDGLVSCLIMSGGPGDGSVHETQAMRSMAIELGVPDYAILLDPDGLNTDATARNTAELFRAHNIHRVLAVSHFYHLPRVKLAFQRQGVNVFTVPAKESYILTAMPIYITREVAALWWYWV